MFSLLSPLTKVLSVATLALLLALGAALFSLRSAYREQGSTQTLLEAEKRTSERVGSELRASEKALDVHKLEIAKNEALLIANEVQRNTLEKRVTVLTNKLNKLGATRYDPPAQLCPSNDHQPTLDDLLDAPLPAQLVDWLRDALSQTAPGGQGGEVVTPGTPDAPLPVTGPGSDDAAGGVEPDRADRR